MAFPAALLPAESNAGPARIYQCDPGPWGQLEYTRIVIEPPDEFMARDYSAAPTRWSFSGWDEARLEQLWQEAGLDASQTQALRSAPRDPAAKGLAILPPDDLVLGLSAKSRATIYNALAWFPANPLQREPFRFRAEMVDEWFADANVGAEVEQRIRALLYRRGNALLFSDPGLVLPLLPSAEDRVRLVKTLARKSSLLVKLRVGPESDIDAVASYWSSSRRRKDVRPLLQSLSRHPGGMTIDLVHLLPRFARGLIYTYPSPDIPLALAPDCHWTAMNFFNDTPDTRFDNIDYLKQVLLRDYVQVTGSKTLGDILILTRPDGDVVHSCIYIAADIVFTKNGQSHTVPWTLTTLPDLQAFYPADPHLEVRVFRRKE